MRIVTLLPSATEICFALDLGNHVVGVSHECDYPAEAKARPALTAATIAVHGSSAEINSQVAQRQTQGLSIYDIDEDALAALAPDLIITQDTCDVCAVSLADVKRATGRLLGREVRVVSLAPMGLADVWDDIERVAEAAGVPERGAELAASLKRRVAQVTELTQHLPRQRTLALEWLDPPMVAGHWTPEIIRAAGGEPVLGHERAKTRAVPWEQITTAKVDRILVAPCGFPLERSLSELPSICERLPAAPITVADGNAYFNRPGPRLADSVEITALALHPDAMRERFGHYQPEALRPFLPAPTGSIR